MAFSPRTPPQADSPGAAVDSAAPIGKPQADETPRAWSPGAPLFLGAFVAGMLGAVVVYLLQPEPLAATEADPSPPAAIVAFWDDAPGVPPQPAAVSPHLLPTASARAARAADRPLTAAAAAAAAAAAQSASPWQPRQPSAAPLLTLAQLLELKAVLARNGADVASDGGGDGLPSSAADQLLFADATQRFLQLQAQPASELNAAERRALADLVDDALESRLQRRDIPLADARALKALVLETQEADADLRAARLVRWTDSHSATPGAAAASDASRASGPGSPASSPQPGPR